MVDEQPGEGYGRPLDARDVAVVAIFGGGLSPARTSID